MNSLLITLLFLLFPLVFAGFWCVVCLLLARIGGWRRLARDYATDQMPHGTRFSWQSGYVGFVGYRNCLNVNIAGDGLFLSVIWPFRVGHKTLFFPWSAIHDVQARQMLWYRSTRFEVGTPSVARLQLPERVFEAPRPSL